MVSQAVNTEATLVPPTWSLFPTFSGRNIHASDRLEAGISSMLLQSTVSMRRSTGVPERVPWKASDQRHGGRQETH